MKLKHLFTVNIFFAVFSGVTCAFFAGWGLRLHGLAPDVGSLWTTRLIVGEREAIDRTSPETADTCNFVPGPRCFFIRGLYLLTV